MVEAAVFPRAVLTWRCRAKEASPYRPFGSSARASAARARSTSLGEAGRDRQGCAAVKKKKWKAYAFAALFSPLVLGLHLLDGEMAIEHLSHAARAAGA